MMMGSLTALDTIWAHASTGHLVRESMFAQFQDVTRIILKQNISDPLALIAVYQFHLLH